MNGNLRDVWVQSVIVVTTKEGRGTSDSPVWLCRSYFNMDGERLWFEDEPSE